MGKNKRFGGLGSAITEEPKVEAPVEPAKEEAKPVSEMGSVYGAVNDASQFPEFQQTNMLSLSPEIEQYLLTKGFVARFINWGQYRQNTNMHRSGWRPYEFGADVRNARTTWAGTIDSEGLIRRGDLVLAVRPVKMHEEHQAQLNALNSQYKSFEKKKANDFREFARERGVKTAVSEGTVTTTKV